MVHLVFKVLWYKVSDILVLFLMELKMFEIRKPAGAKFICEKFLDVFWWIVTINIIFLRRWRLSYTICNIICEIYARLYFSLFIDRFPFMLYFCYLF